MQIEVITGPTASGKSSLALQKAEENPAIEIINADASLLYKGFDIGTAKPSRDIRQSIPHHLVDLLEPNEQFNAADYAKLARETIRNIIAKSKIPLVVGGTGFYIDALFFGITTFDTDEQSLGKARLRFEKELQENGFDIMLIRLQNIDPVLHEQISRERNPRRLERAWEFYYATGKPLGEARKEKPEPFEFEPSFTLIDVERSQLQQRIIRRIDIMLEAGWVKEVEYLLSSGVTPEMPAMNAIGYREIADVILQRKNLSEAREEIIIRTRQYAKRQVTWMKRYKSL